jgi:hypothetical protein
VGGDIGGLVFLEASLLEELADSCGKSFQVLGLAFPDHEYVPPVPLQSSRVTGISSLIGLQFLTPICAARLRRPSAAARMTVPETAVDEDRHALIKQDNIWSTRQASDA